MTADELLFGLAPDARAAQAARESIRAFSDLRRSADGEYLRGRCQGSSHDPYSVLARRADVVRCACDCSSMKYPCKHALALVALSAGSPERFTPFTPTPAEERQLADAAGLALPAAPEAPASAGEALLQAIFANPSDDAARLIYADWLSDHGTPADHDLADFIRVETLGGPAARRERLWKAHRAKWLAHVPLPLRNKVDTLGGFVRHAALTWTQLARHGEQLAEHYPLDGLQLSGKLDARTAGKVGVFPLWQRIRRLTIIRSDIPVPILNLFLSSHYLSGVRELSLLRLGWGIHEIRLLASWPGLAGVETLRIDEERLTPGAAAHLINAPLRALQQLLLRVPITEGALIRSLAIRFGDRITLLR